MRDSWEDALFGGAYRRAAPRFGSCHVRLRPEAGERATFCFGDSHLGPADIGTFDALHPVLAAVVAEIRALPHGRPRGTRTGDLLEGLGPPVEWHTGFVLRPAGLDDKLAAFRGPALPSAVTSPPWTGRRTAIRMKSCSTSSSCGTAWPGSDHPL
ncbi:DUF3626 domain-containing protein [Streptomyces endophyticus]|uniref:DUF3626 domain-containing protein n=1 Tax=Streptomyces endophyticus TaxID=714166 RepID=A0ABU6EYH2_9ACTN|nr:DUF3626 domain-containing protein [Streptomyces endophyticus]MEB8336240.1 DUF3626 domain-containing protein [Streptomyces endophyticus]